MKEIFVGELQPDETVDAMREARLLSTVGLIFHIYKVTYCQYNFHSVILKQSLVIIPSSHYCLIGKLELSLMKHNLQTRNYQ